jgi:hypothetical protein
LNQDFDLTNLFVRYELQGARTNLSADLGDTIVTQRNESTGGGLVKLNLSRTLSPASKISLTLGRDSTDASASFAGIQPGATGAVGAAAAPNVSESYSRTYGTVNWEYQRNRTSLGLSGNWEKDEYAGDSALNRTLSTGELRLQRRLREAFTVQIAGRLYKTDYGNINLPASSGSPNIQTSSVTASLTWHHGRALDLKLALDHTNYSTSPNDVGYHDNRVFLTVGYRRLKASPVNDPSPAR